MKDFKKLKVWEKGMAIVSLTYELTKRLLDNEKFALTSQMTRAAVSIPSN
ncbi:MAG: four helix bundle protein [Nonlabens sp.]|jgi:four helix bundle protein